MRLRARLAVGILAIVLLLLAPLGYALYTLDQVRKTTQGLSEKEFAASLVLGRIQSSLADLRNGETQLVLFPDDSSGPPRLQAAIEALAHQSDTLERFRKQLESFQIRENITKVRELAGLEVAAAAKKTATRTRVLDSISNDVMRPAIERIEIALRQTANSLTSSSATQVASSATISQNARYIAMVGAILALLSATAIALWLTLSIAEPVRDLERGMHAVADGDFTVRTRITPRRHDEFGRLAASFEKMASQLAQLDRLKAEFVSVASHELKTPINVILGYLQLLQEGVYGAMTPKQREICATLSSQGHLLSRLVRQLLDVSRFEAGGGKLDVRRVNLVGFLDELESAFRVLAMQRGIRFEIERGPDLPTTVVWDEDRMNEVLGNLISNAFKFTERGGRVELALQADESAVTMDVRDTGAGIPPENLPRIFDKFYQADNQTAAAAKGTGLGLAIAKGIVEAHGGTISVDSTIGVGTVFTIVMPIATNARRGPVTPRRSFAAALR
jgi:signal transduction histidine kinase